VRPDCEPFLDRVPKQHVEERRAAKVARRRHARCDELAGVLRHPQQEAVFSLGGGGLPAKADVDVAVDKPGQDGRVPEVANGGAFADKMCPLRTDADDCGAVEEHLTVADNFARLPGEDPVGAQQLQGHG
jgi:hypothetical protein